MSESRLATVSAHEAPGPAGASEWLSGPSNPQQKSAMYRDVGKVMLLVPEQRLIVLLVIASVLAALAEGLGIGTVVAVLDAPGAGGGILTNVPVLRDLAVRFDGFTLIERLRLAAIVLVMTVFTREALSWAAKLLGVHYHLAIELELGRSLFKQLHDVEIAFIDRQQIGDLLTVLGPFVRRVGGTVHTVTGSLLQAFTVCLYLLMMVLVSWQASLFALSFLGLLSALMGHRALTQPVKAAGKAERSLRRKVQTAAIESLTAMKLIHLHNQEQRSVARYGKTLTEVQALMFRGQKWIVFTPFLYNVLVALILALMLIAGTFVLSGEPGYQIAQIVFFIGVVFRLMGPMSGLNQTRARIYNDYPALQSILSLLERSDKPYPRLGHLVFDELRSGIEFEDVTFRYDPREEPVLDGISFEVPRGKVTALVGPSGAGKTTVINLINRFYEVTSGRVMVDGTDILELEVTSWREALAVVTQDAHVLSDSVLENLRFARNDASEEELRRAADLAQASDFIGALPDGYQTQLGDRGVRLSGGQRQRIGIARAVLVDPQLLVLDEATSELDSETEAAIHDAIFEFGRGRTVLVIAHRLATVRDADNIVVLDRGKVVEQGTHEQLMALRGRYWQLVQAQGLGR